MSESYLYTAKLSDAVHLRSFEHSNILHLHLCNESLFVNIMLYQVSAALVTLTVLAETYLWQQDWQQQLLHFVPDLLLPQTAELLGASVAAELASEPQPAAPAALLALALAVASESAINTSLAVNTSVGCKHTCYLCSLLDIDAQPLKAVHS